MGLQGRRCGVVAGDDEHIRLERRQNRQGGIHFLDDLDLGIEVAVLAATVSVLDVAEHEIVVVPNSRHSLEFIGGAVVLLLVGGCLEWGSHCVDLCQWANDADNTAPVEYEPKGKELHAWYGNDVKLVLRDEGWLKLGSCPVRFEGDTGCISGRPRAILR